MIVADTSSMSESKSLDILTVTATELQELYSNGSLTSVTLVKSVLEQIEKHNTGGRNLRALISVAPRQQIIERAEQLDHERNTIGKARSHVHGIPFIVKV